MFACLMVGSSFAASVYDPCGDHGSVAQGDGFTIGLAFWSGGSLDDWKGILPCNYEDRLELISQHVFTGVFRPKVDTMTVLHGSRQDQDFIFAQQPNATVMSVVAYQGNNSLAVRSYPRFIRRFDTGETTGTGYVAALTLIARLDKGKLDYLQWHDMGCGECGGSKASTCVDVGDNHRACATSEEECDLLNPEDTGDPETRCQLSIYIAFSGTDKYSTPLTSAAQIESLNDFSATSFYSSSSETASNTID